MFVYVHALGRSFTWLLKYQSIPPNSKRTAFSIAQQRRQQHSTQVRLLKGNWLIHQKWQMSSLPPAALVTSTETPAWPCGNHPWIAGESRHITCPKALKAVERIRQHSAWTQGGVYVDFELVGAGDSSSCEWKSTLPQESGQKTPHSAGRHLSLWHMHRSAGHSDQRQEGTRKSRTIQIRKLSSDVYRNTMS